MHVGN
jgi:hypothetical protein